MRMEVKMFWIRCGTSNARFNSESCVSAVSKIQRVLSIDFQQVSYTISRDELNRASNRDEATHDGS
jgi:hypothetical protein